MLKFSKKYLYKILAIFFISLTSSCFQATYKLWHIHDYIEDFQHFFISQDRKFVIFVGEKFHYVFNDYSEILENILSLEDRKNLFIDVDDSYIEIDKNNNINGYIVFDVFNEKLNSQLEFFLAELGFYKNLEGMTKKFNLKGKRYFSHDKFIESLPSFDQKYPIEVRVKLNKGEDFVATIISPLTITADGFIAIGEMILNPFYD
jgi:hypothetical protein